MENKRIAIFWSKIVAPAYGFLDDYSTRKSIFSIHDTERAGKRGEKCPFLNLENTLHKKLLNLQKASVTPQNYVFVELYACRV